MEKSGALTGVRKRQQIRTANKTVFAWIISASVVIGICGVVAQFLIRQLLFNNKILSAIGTTNKTLQSNLTAYDGLKADVTKLLADGNLSVLRKGDNSTALQVVIDALPTEENRAALATSMQSEVLEPAGVNINTFSVIDATVVSNTVSPQDVPSFGFNFSISGNYAQVTQAVRNIERSIRPLNIQSLQLQGSDTQLKADIVVLTYYQPAKGVQLKEASVKP